MMYKGFTGKILRIDLSSGEISTEPTRQKDAEQYLGGRGIAARILYDEVGPAVDPFSPDNRLIFFTGSLTGTKMPFTPKHVVVTKSPLTGGYTRSITGGYWGPELKFAGYDGIVVKGKAQHPVYIRINDDEVEICDASHLWGKTVPDTEQALHDELANRNYRVCCIGPAGEKLVRFASVVNDTYRFAGRGGTGAIMGSKNLKAIVVKGSKQVSIAHPDRLEQDMPAIYRDVVTHPTYVSRMRFGAMETVPLVCRYGMISVHYFADTVKSDWENFRAESMVDNHWVRDDSCYACPHKCLKYTMVKEGKWAGAMAEGPKYETMCMFGPNVDNTDLSAIVKGNEICASYGMDSASAGNAVAFAMKLIEEGVLRDKSLIGDMDLRFGSGDGMVDLLQAIATRDGLGDILAEGVKRAADIIGDGAQKYALHIKGQEFASFDPRGYPAMGLAYATSNRGACHMGPPFRVDKWWADKDPDSPERWMTLGKSPVVIKCQNLYAILDSMMYCTFSRGGFTPERYCDFYNHVTGMDLDWDYANDCAQRIFSLERAFNVREGFGRADDELPEQFVSGPRGLPLKEMLDEYYQYRGWDQNGVPKEI